MKVFISWSGPRSKAMAEALRNLLPSIVQVCTFWISSHDIDAGDRWGSTLARELEQTRFGILCLTSENLAAPWLLFEAGALSKVVDGTNVCPLLLDVRQADIKGPLAQFQSVEADKEGVRKLVKAINHALGDQALDENIIDKVFNALWPDFETSIQAIPENTQEAMSLRRTPDDLLDEVLRTIREQSRMLSDLMEFQSRQLYIEPNPERPIYFQHVRAESSKKPSDVSIGDVTLINSLLIDEPLRFAEIKKKTGFSERRLANIIGYMDRNNLIIKDDVDRRYRRRIS